MKLYGIPNCTTVKKARAWLAGHALEVAFHDFKKQGVDAAWLRKVAAQTGWQALLNTRGTTWRKLTPAQQAIADTAGAIALMQALPSLIRRPLVESTTGALVVGFDPEAFERLPPCAAQR